MKKNLSKIIISFFILSIFLMPISPVFNKQKDLQSFKVNKVMSVELPQLTIGDIVSGGNTATGVAFDATIARVGAAIEGETKFGCNANPATWFTNCIALFLYTIIWEPVAALTSVSAKILDYFIYYSTNSSSFKTGFVEKGWAAVRDIANMFFILVLLYVAIKTVLGINVTDNKRIIGYIIIFALLINFSLFVTRVVIDSSNILAKVFYNNITTKNADGTEAKTSSGEKSISEKLAGRFDPVTIIKDGGMVVSNNPGKVVVITLITIVVMGFMMYVFLSVALLFVARVISLWLSMIFSPLAFVSYILPFKIPSFGHEEWWSELLKNAFLAPIFIFFLYIILQFGNALPGLALDIDAGETWVDIIVKTLVPFVIVVILLIQSKKLAVLYAGKMGEMVIKAAKVVGGVALGAAAGAAALVAAPLVGGAASGIMGSTAGKAMAQTALTGTGARGFMARAGMKTLNYAKTASFDPRKGFVGNQMTKITGMDFQKLPKMIGLGVKEGGFDGANKRREEKILKNFDQFKTTMSDAEVKAWSAKRMQEYEDRRRQAEQAGELKEFDKSNEKPQEFSSATELNNSKLKEYMDRIIKTGPISLLAEIKLKNRGEFLDELNDLNYKESPEYKKAKADNKDVDLGDDEIKKFIENTNKERDATNTKNLRQEKLSVGKTTDLIPIINSKSVGEENALKKMEGMIAKGEKAQARKTKTQAELDELKNEEEKLQKEYDEIYGTPELVDKEKKRKGDAVEDEYKEKEEKNLEKERSYVYDKEKQEILVRKLKEELGDLGLYRAGEDFQKAISNASREVAYSMREMEETNNMLMKEMRDFDKAKEELKAKRDSENSTVEKDNLTRKMQEIDTKVAAIKTQRQSIQTKYFTKATTLESYKNGAEAGGKIKLANDNIQQIRGEIKKDRIIKAQKIEEVKASVDTEKTKLKDKIINTQNKIHFREDRQEKVERIATKAESKPESTPPQETK